MTKRKFVDELARIGRIVNRPRIAIVIELHIAAVAVGGLRIGKDHEARRIADGIGHAPGVIQQHLLDAAIGFAIGQHLGARPVVRWAILKIWLTPRISTSAIAMEINTSTSVNPRRAGHGLQLERNWGHGE